MSRFKHLFYLKDVILAANDEKRNRKGTDQLSVLVMELTINTGYVKVLYVQKQKKMMQGGCQQLKKRGRCTMSTWASLYSLQGPGELHQLMTLPRLHTAC